MHFTRGGLKRHRGLPQMLVRAMHAALGRRFLVLLDGHGATPCEKSNDCTCVGFLGLKNLARLFQACQRREGRLAGFANPRVAGLAL